MTLSFGVEDEATPAGVYQKTLQIRSLRDEIMYMWHGTKLPKESKKKKREER
jgi:hypothetical protein